MKRESRGWTSQAVRMKDYPRRSSDLPRGPRFYTDKDIVERAGKRGAEAAKQTKRDEKKPRKRTVQDE